MYSCIAAGGSKGLSRNSRLDSGAIVTPAKAGVQSFVPWDQKTWIPAFPGMTVSAPGKEDGFEIGSTDFETTPKHHHEEAKLRLALLLWERLSARNLCSPPRSAVVRLAVTALGKPFLVNGGSDGPSISFSRSGGMIWAAACGCHAEIGVDAACALEFAGNYPLHRVGTRDEYAVVGSLTGGDSSEAAALIWSVKESYAKALGCGFHLFDPLQIRIENVCREGQSLFFIVSLSEKGQEKVSAHCSKAGICPKSEEPSGFHPTDRIGIECAGQMAYAESKRVGMTWLSIATVDRGPFVIR